MESIFPETLAYKGFLKLAGLKETIIKTGVEPVYILFHVNWTDHTQPCYLNPLPLYRIKI
jgi:hypothetical protein